jgi:hypothetical protein
MSTERRIPLRIASKRAYVWDVDGAVSRLLCEVNHALINLMKDRHRDTSL